MSESQLLGPVEEFAHFLTGLASLLDPGSGWYGVFAHRDPDGLRACLDGRDVPPWDVVESMLHDLAGLEGDEAAHTAGPRARRLHARAMADHDAQPGGKPALQDRLEVMLREHQHAALRARELQGAVWAAAGTQEGARLAEELAWAQDDHARAGVRVRELRARLERLTKAEAESMGWGREARAPASPQPRADAPRPRAPEPPAEAAVRGPAAQATAQPAPQPAHQPTARPTAAPAPAPASTAEPAPAPAAPPAPEPDARTFTKVKKSAKEKTKEKAKGRTKDKVRTKAAGRPRGARFAGLDLGDEDTGGQPAAALLPSLVPEATQDDPPGGAPSDEDGQAEAATAPRGARFAGAYDEAPPAHDTDTAAASVAPVDDEARRAIADAVARLAQLHTTGGGGLAYTELCAAAGRPAHELPLFIGELERRGLESDVPTLLWEVASLPPEELAAAADTLAAAGRTDDGFSLLRQSVARPVEEVAHAAQVLLGRHRPAQALELFAALVRARTPEESVMAAAVAPDTLAPLLLEAAGTVSRDRHSDIAHALRAVGLDAHP
ncbi:hypothetical protein [Streptomyces piniterrae]|uniref:hypothetical protein n=1 Tax=Streptomyces piniterrae TaxID=2571125 RepID=UPI00145FB9C6|nr:hypothetical protein [Streptomyces piniterrae]